MCNGSIVYLLRQFGVLLEDMIARALQTYEAGMSWEQAVKPIRKRLSGREHNHRRENGGWVIDFRTKKGDGLGKTTSAILLGSNANRSALSPAQCIFNV
jgi:hypothetical protein